jgi:AcrR family transcriptional regulator
VATKPRNRKPLSRDRVLEEAIAFADAQGIEALSMRKLGQALGVEAMSLYNHVANKRALVDAMVDRVVEQFELPDDEAGWDASIRRCAISAHDVLIEHPWACSLALVPRDVRNIGGPRFRYMEWLLRTFREAGFSPEVTYSAYHTVDSHIFGFTLWQLSHADAANAQVQPAGESFAEWAERFLAEMRPQFPYLAEHGEQHMQDGARSGREEYEFALDLLLDGLRRLK